MYKTSTRSTHNRRLLVGTRFERTTPSERESRAKPFRVFRVFRGQT